VVDHFRRKHKEEYGIHIPQEGEDNNFKLMEFIARRNHPFALVEQEEFKALLKFEPASRSCLTTKYLPMVEKKYLLTVNFPHTLFIADLLIIQK
jgi:hypothetical protein